MDFQSMPLREAFDQPKALTIRTRFYSAAEWELQKPLIEQFYVQEGRTCKETMAILKGKGFSVSEKQIKSRLTKWNFDIKNIRGNTMRAIAKVQARRQKEQGKESVFKINNRSVHPRNIKRFLLKKNISEDELLTTQESDDTVEYTVYTPRPSTPSSCTGLTYQGERSHHPTLFREPGLPIGSVE
ncbi:hypothetical protein B7463_g11097, partial [Scytalidium lignicola]